MRQALLVLAVLALSAAAAPLTGSLSLDQAAPSWGDEITFTVETEGRLGPHTSVFVTVVCVQNGDVVLQYSAADPYAVPLVQQEGLFVLGHKIDVTAPGDCAATLIARTRRSGEDDIAHLDETAFTVA